MGVGAAGDVVKGRGAGVVSAAGAGAMGMPVASEAIRLSLYNSEMTRSLSRISLRLIKLFVVFIHCRRPPV